MNTKLSVNEAALKLNISPQSVKRWINQGKLNGEKFNGKWYVIVNEIFEHQLDTNDIHLDTNNGSKDLRDEIQHLRNQLTRCDEQIDALTRSLDQAQQLLAVQTKTNASLTDRLQAIEDMRHRPWWRFWRQ
jgi:flagellar capping protein FliD